ncbi:ATP synthase F1 subunit delta [Urechidicola croceus]|uniref:ATP synthase subunit delta n=1 Tax=Urechidicola croceus TaxID=1850246 RepID=A0A1D8P933_9FLAO|nr:ATP synthase F1 subunit delta [Urechidicola croceus]AOW21049.1 ATP synthase F1 subunit delta [Urechidicola croceus]
MSNNRAALRYAKAILSLSEDQKVADETYNNMQLISETISDSDELQSMLGSSLVKSDVKKNALLAIFDKKINTVSQGLIDLLISNKRLSDFGAVATQYVKLYDSLNGKEVATVTSAIPLTEALKTQVLAKVKELTGNEASLENIINPDILGGFILRVGDIQYDASIANKLNVLKREFNTQN